MKDVPNRHELGADAGLDGREAERRKFNMVRHKDRSFQIKIAVKQVYKHTAMTIQSFNSSVMMTPSWGHRK